MTNTNQNNNVGPTTNNVNNEINRQQNENTTDNNSIKTVFRVAELIESNIKPGADNLVFNPIDFKRDLFFTQSGSVGFIPRVSKEPSSSSDDDDDEVDTGSENCSVCSDEYFSLDDDEDVDGAEEPGIDMVGQRGKEILGTKGRVVVDVWANDGIDCVIDSVRDVFDNS